MKITKDLNTLTKSEFITIFGSIFEKSEWIAKETFNLKPFKNSKDLVDKMINIYDSSSVDKILEILPSYDIPTTLLHWFDGSKKQLQKTMDLNCYVSFGPVMVYSKDKQVLLSKTNKDKILVETDGPVRFSRCFKNKTAQIDFIPSIIFCASKVLHMNYDELCDVIDQNSKHFLIL